MDNSDLSPEIKRRKNANPNRFDPETGKYDSKPNNPKDYYKKIYAQNRERLLAKVECEFCGRTRTAGNLKTHQKTNICQAVQKALMKAEFYKNKD